MIIPFLKFLYLYIITFGKVSITERHKDFFLIRKKSLYVTYNIINRKGKWLLKKWRYNINTYWYNAYSLFVYNDIYYGCKYMDINGEILNSDDYVTSSIYGCGYIFLTNRYTKKITLSNTKFKILHDIWFDEFMDTTIYYNTFLFKKDDYIYCMSPYYGIIHIISPDNPIINFRDYSHNTWSFHHINDSMYRNENKAFIVKMITEE